MWQASKCVPAALLLITSTTSANAASDKRNFIMGTYDEVIVEGDIEVEIANNVAPFARAEGDPYMVDAVKIVRNGKQLRIYMGPTSRTRAGSLTGPLVVKLGGRNLQKLAVRGSGRVKVDTVKGALGRFEITGSGEIIADNIQTDKLVALLNGSGKLQIGKGAARDGAIFLRGPATIAAPAVSFGTASLGMNGSGVADISANSAVSITASGAGSITVGGSGSCIIKQQGQTKISCKNINGTK